MKKLTRFLFVVFIITISSESIAQRYTVVAGLNLSNMLFKSDDEIYSDDYKTRPGFHLGATVQFPKTGRYSFETGLIFSTKGHKVEKDSTYSHERDLFYIDIPLLAKASFEVGKVTCFTVLGPYLGLGLYSDSLPYFDFLKRVDFGLTAGAGVVIIKTIQIGLFYDLGLKNLSPYPDITKIKNRVFRISVGFKFGRK